MKRIVLQPFDGKSYSKDAYIEQKLNTWAVAESHRKIWQELIGDTVLFVEGGYIFLIATITSKIEDEKGNPERPLRYFFEDIKYVNISMKKLNEELGYSPKNVVQGFYRIREELTEKTLDFLKNYIFEEDESIYSSLKDDIDAVKNQNIPETQKKSLINSRLGQGKYRKDLKELWNESCSITKFNQIDIFIASHIKPWNVSTNEERLDKFNGFFLIPTLDKLFDRGYISFNENGNILISSDIEEESYDKLNINKNMKIDIFDENKKYLEYHRKEIFHNN